MINQLLRLGALIATGRFLKHRIKGLLWIAAVWLVLWYSHSEFVNYVELSGDTGFVLYASLIKTGLYLLSIASYVWLVERKLWPKAVKIPSVTNASQSTSQTTTAARTDKSGVQENDDGFDFLREKKQLKNPVDVKSKT